MPPSPSSATKPYARKLIIVVIGIGGLAAVILATVLSMIVVEQFLNPFDTSTINSVIVTVIIILGAWLANKKFSGF
jgi:amino acid transporter